MHILGMKQQIRAVFMLEENKKKERSVSDLQFLYINTLISYLKYFIKYINILFADRHGKRI